MIIFNTDLDNTLIYSYKHDIGENPVPVEIYKDREVSFMTQMSIRLLREISGMITVVPTTTRTVEQYERIDMKIGVSEFALTCNGGVLLVNGERDEGWYEESLDMISDSASEMKVAERVLQKDEDRSMELRDIEKLFLFTKSNNPEQSVKILQQSVDPSVVDVFMNGVKVYAVPKALNKGRAVARLREKTGAKYVIAAGDSEFDIPMMREADLSLAPSSLKDSNKISSNNQNNKIEFFDENDVFSDQLLSFIYKKIKSI